MLTRLTLGLLWLLHFLPQRLLARVGQGIGLAFMALGRERRRVAQVNLALCFPELTPRQRQKLARQHFMAAGRALAETTIAWWSSAARLCSLARLEGAEHLHNACESGPTIIFAPHFVGVDILAIRLSIERNAISMYSRQKNPVFDRFLVSRRMRFRPIRLVSRQDGIKPVIRGLREGLPFFFLPDMDYGARHAVFVPFFKVPAATIDALPRLAAATGAKILPVIVTQLRRGYVIRFFPVWSDYPGADVLRDTARMNEFIEEHARASPEQYYWLHKRFKTRPPGEKRLY